MSVEKSKDQSPAQFTSEVSAASGFASGSGTGPAADLEARVAKTRQRLCEGLNTVVLGDGDWVVLAKQSGAPPAQLRFVVIDCGVHPQPLGAIGEAQRRLGELLDGGRSGPGFGLLPGLDGAADRVLTGLRRRLIGELPEQPPDVSFVLTLSRLAQQTGSGAQVGRDGQRWVIVFSRVERADADTLHLLKLLIARKLPVPLLLVVSRQAAGSSGAVAELLEAAREGGGEEAVMLLNGAAAEASEGADFSSVLRSLPTGVLAVLRGLAIAGAGCELPVLTALLGLGEDEVLELLQQAADAGLAITDDGEGRFELPPSLTKPLLAKMLPSVVRGYHRRLARLLSERQLPVATDREDRDDAGSAQLAVPSARSVPEPSATENRQSGTTEDAPVGVASRLSEVLAGSERTPPSANAPHPSVSPPAIAAEVPLLPEELGPTLHWPYAAVAGESATSPTGSEVAVADVPPASVPSAAGPRREIGRQELPAPGPGRSARAARHFVESGDTDHGIERYLLAAEQALRVGALREAMALTDRAMHLLAELPDSELRRALRIRALCAIGRIRWLGNGPDERFTLASALLAVRDARALLRPTDPAELRAVVASLLAAVLYEIGDLPSLEAALHELTEASRALLAQGDPAAAARLLNDQAAVYVRIGDPVRAAHMLEESRRFFASNRFSPDDEWAVIELAETEHLLARLPLHVAARPGRQREAAALGRSHAQEAATTYQRLGMRRELAHVLETLGRLETLAERHEAAIAQLSAAAQIERELQDLLGLARTTAAMADVLLSVGQLGGALGLLAEALALNVAKGSPIGLAFVRRGVERIAAQLESHSGAGSVDAKVKQALPGLLEELGAAEEQLGRVRLPADL